MRTHFNTESKPDMDRLGDACLHVSTKDSSTAQYTGSHIKGFTAELPGRSSYTKDMW
jgi:hypothetical protein